MFGEGVQKDCACEFGGEEEYWGGQYLGFLEPRNAKNNDEAIWA